MPDNVALYYDQFFLGHDTLTHIESISRVESCLRLLEDSGVAELLARPQCRDATDEELARVHTMKHIANMKRVGDRGPTMVGLDTIANFGTYPAAVRAAGAVVGATEAVVQGEFERAFCLTRPPGHHAVATNAMGFCFFNQVAVAAAHARAALGIERLAIVDIDIHHGNGTQDSFYADPTVLYTSTHQFPYYPGTGHWREAGDGEGRGFTLNLSLPEGCGDIEYTQAFERAILPKLYDYRPQLILVSAGYDAHHADPIDGAGMRLSCAGYASLIGHLRTASDELCNGRIVVVLEGGYDLTALPWSVRNSIETLLAEPITPDPIGPAPDAPSPDIEPLLEAVRDLHGIGR